MASAANKKKKITIFIFSLLLFIPLISRAKGAYFYMSPSSGVYSQGNDLLVDVRFDSGGEAVNAAEATIFFNPTKLKAIEIIKQGSAFDSWLPETSFSNEKGEIDLKAGSAKEVISSNGRLALIRFKVVASGKTTIYFRSGVLLKANGQATNILDQLKPASFVLEQGKDLLPYLLKGQLSSNFEAPPQRPVVYSYTNPDEDLWSANNSPEFRWETSSKILAVAFCIDKKPINIPLKIYKPDIDQAKFNNLEDGIWYFHLRLKNKYGWSKTTNRRVMIDTVPPEQFEIKINNNSDQTNPSPTIEFKTKDSLSGIDHYQLRIDSLPPIRLESSQYKPKPLKPGIHTVIIKAYDRAGNFVVNIKDFQIKPLTAPKITNFLPRIVVGDPLVIKGKTNYPQATINIFLTNGSETKKFSTQADDSGNWFFAYEKGLLRGVYQISAQVKDKRGALSLPTTQRIVLVSYPVLIRIGRVAISYLTVFLSLIGLVIFLILIIFYAWYRTKLWKKKLSLETKEMYTKIAKAFVILDKELKSQIEYLDSKPGFSEEEELIYHRLKMVIKHTENIIGKKVEDLKKDLGIE